MIIFDWDDKRWKGKKGSRLFEEVCSELLCAMSYKEVNWRQGSYDKGRDITCFSEAPMPGGNIKREKWFCGCKYSVKSINKDTIRNEVDWADASKPDYLLIITQSHLTPSTKEWIEEMNENRGKSYKIDYWEKSRLQMYIEQYGSSPNMIGFFPEQQLDQLIRKARETSFKTEDKYFANVQRIKGEIAKLNPDSDANKIIGKYEYLHELAENSNKLHQAAGFLEYASIASKRIDDKKKEIEILRKLGETYLAIGWDTLAEGELSRAFESAKEVSDKTLLAEVGYSLGKAYHAGSIYDEARWHYQNARGLFSSLRMDEKMVSAEVSLATLALDFDIETEFPIQIDTLKTRVPKNKKFRDKTVAVELQIILARLFMKTKAYDKASQAINAAKKMLKKNRSNVSNAMLRVLLEEAHIAYLTDDKELAIKVLEDDCLDVARKLQDEQQIMLILRQSSFIRTFRERPAATTAEDWEARSRANDLSRKFETEFSRAREQRLDAAWSLVRKEFRDSLIALNRSRQSFRQLGDFIDEIGIKKEMASLHERAGNLLAALDDAIEIGDSDRALKLSKTISTIIDREGVPHLFESLLELSGMSVVQRAAIAATFEGLDSIVPDQYVDKVVSKLIELGNDNYSFISNFNVRGKALEALVHYSMAARGEKVFDLLGLLRKVYVQNEPWQNRRSCIEIYKCLCRPLKDEVEERLYHEVYSLVENLKQGDPNYFEVLTLGAKFCNTLKDSRKKEFVQAMRGLFTDQINLLGVEILLSFGEEFPEKVITNFVEMLLNRLDEQVLIEDKSVREQPTPTRKGFTMYHTAPLGENRRVTVGEGADFSLFHILKDKFPTEFRARLVHAVIRNIKDEHNSLMNKYQLTYLLGEIRDIVPEELVKDVVELLCSLSSGDVPLSEQQKDEIAKERNPFSPGRMTWGLPENVVGPAISTMVSYTKLMDEPAKQRALRIILEQSRSDKKEIRREVAYAIRELDPIDESLQLSVLLLANDSDLDVAASAVPTFAMISDKLDVHLLMEGIDRICSRIQLNSLALRLTTATAFQELLKKTFIDQVTREKFLNCLHVLANDKYLRVRRHAQEILSTVG